MAEKRKRILVCPLNWGLGHAARDVAIVSRLADLGHEVVLAGDGTAMDLLCAEFPELESYHLKSDLRIRYSRFLPAWLKITLLAPLILYEIFAEHYRLGRIIREIKPDVIISDNRYGLWSRKVKSILVTHQLSIRLPGFVRFLEYPVHLVIRFLVSRFDRCWIPDFPGEKNLSGILSHRYPLPRNTIFIGAISRFVQTWKLPDYEGFQETGEFRDSGDFPRNGNIPPILFPGQSRPVNLVIILSGPEPQRSYLQKIVLKQVLSLNSSCVILQGIPGRNDRVDMTSRVTMYSHLPVTKLRQLLLSAENVICRAGYTSIMDLFLMQKKAMIIPTPGQTEQEYLARYLSEKGIFLNCSQDELDIKSALGDLDDFKPEFNVPGEDLLGLEIGFQVLG